MMKRVKKISVAMLMVVMASVGFTGCSGCGKENAETVTDMLTDAGEVMETVESSEDIGKIAESGEVTAETEDSEEVTESAEETKETETTEESEESTEAVRDSKEPEDTKPSDTKPSDGGGSSNSGQTPTPTPSPEPEVHVHSWVEDVTEATCDMGKVITTKCSGCGEVQGTRTEGSGLGHNFVETLLYAANCNATGYRDVTCSRCKANGPGHGDIPMLPHTFETKVVTEGDCKSAQVREDVCTVCNYHTPYVYDWDAHANDHVWVTGTYQEWSDEAFAMVDVERTYCGVCNRDKL